MIDLKSALKKLNRRDTKIIPRLPSSSKILLLISILVVSTVFVKIIRAQSTQSEIQDGLTGQTPGTIAQQGWGRSYLVGQLVSVSDFAYNLSNIPGITYQGKNDSVAWNGGMLGDSSRLVAAVYTNPPSSGIQYMASLKDQFLGGQPAYAQGVGFTSLQALIPLWKLFRNIVYVVSSLVLVIIGLMIMLRIKISPQAVVTIQNALPQLIITLILVTFSYAIAGFLIDISYFIQGAVLAMLFSARGIGLSSNLINPDNFNLFLNAGQLGQKGFSFAVLSQAGLGDAFNLIYQAGLQLPVAFFKASVTNPILLLASGLFGTAAISTVGAVILALIIFVILLFSILKLFFALLKCYITIIFKIIIGPLEIAMGTFPSAKIGFSSWMTDLVANIAVFPITLLFLVIGNIIVEYATQGSLWVPNLIGKSFPGWLMGATATTTTGSPITSGGDFLVPAIIGIAILTLAPRLPELIIQAVFMLKPSAWETAIGQGPNIAGIVNTAGTLSKISSNISSTYSNLRQHSENAGAKRPNRQNQTAQNQEEIIQRADQEIGEGH